MPASTFAEKCAPLSPDDAMYTRPRSPVTVRQAVNNFPPIVASDGPECGQPLIRQLSSATRAGGANVRPPSVEVPTKISRISSLSTPRQPMCIVFASVKAMEGRQQGQTFSATRTLFSNDCPRLVDFAR